MKKYLHAAFLVLWDCVVTVAHVAQIVGLAILLILIVWSAFHIIVMIGRYLVEGQLVTISETGGDYQAIRHEIIIFYVELLVWSVAGMYFFWEAMKKKLQLSRN